MRSSRRADMNQLRDTMLSLAPPVPRCPVCRTSFVSEAAMQRHVEVVHPTFPAADEDNSE